MESNPGYVYCGAKVCKVLQIMKLCKKNEMLLVWIEDYLQVLQLWF